MNGSALLDLLMSRLGNRTETDLRAKCLQEMTLAQADDLENGPVHPWFLKRESQTVQTAANTRNVSFPTDWLFPVEDQEEPLVYVPSAGTAEIQMKQKALDEALRWYNRSVLANDDQTVTETPGPPEAYSLLEDAWAIFPLPDAIYTLKVYAYYGREAAPQDSTNFENNWMKWAPGLLLAVTGARMCKFHLQGADNIAARFETDIPIQRDKLVRLCTARAEADRERNMG